MSLLHWTDSRRKLMASAVALVCVMGYAIWRTAPFDQVANGIEWILGIFVTGHAATSIMNAKTGGPSKISAKSMEEAK